MVECWSVRICAVLNLWIDDSRSSRERSEVSRHCLCDDTELKLSIAKREQSIQTHE